jgi:hypothetical protein
MAIGARQFDIRLQFLLEAALLGLLGGAAGPWALAGSARTRCPPSSLAHHRHAPGGHDRDGISVRRRDSVWLFSSSSGVEFGSD